jgi:FAD/FMN-containing dehydrogenase
VSAPFAPPSADVANRLKAAVGPGGWSEDPDVIAPKLVEWRDRWHGATPLLLRPATTAEVQAVLRIANAARIAITPQGGNTGLVGAQIPMGEVLLSLDRMTAIRQVSADDDVIVAEAGVVLATVQAAAREVGRRFPLSLASEGTASIGGLISTNAGGVHVRRHGMMRALVLGLEAVLPDGSLFEGLSALRKDNTGYDLKQLFIGAEGTLGVVTAASLKLVPAPAQTAVALLALESPEDAVALLHRLEGETGAVAAFEIMNRTGMETVLEVVAGARLPFDVVPPWTALVEFESAQVDLADLIEPALAGALEAGLAQDAVLSRSETQAKAFWLLREEMSAAQKRYGKAVKHDISVPVARVPAFLAAADAAVRRLAPGARIVAFGHASDGNIHYDVGRDPALSSDAFAALGPAIMTAVHDVAVGLGGSISAEHGIGLARREEFLMREPAAHLAMMRAIKQALDPNGIMNPRVAV